MPGYIFPGAFSPGSFSSGGLPTPSDPTSVAKSFKKNSPGCGCCCKCCDQCEGDSPCRMLVSIGGRRHTLKKNGASAIFTGTSAKYPDTSNTCYWVADITTLTIGTCEIAALSLTLQGPNPSHSDYQWSLIAVDSTGGLVANFTKSSGTTAPACTEPHTLVNTGFGANCDSVGNAVIEPEKKKACDPCCPECAGRSPKRWEIAIGAETFILSDHDYSGAHCNWQTTFAARVFGTSPGMGICEDYTGIKLTTDSLLIKVELTGGTTAVNWSVGFMSTVECDVVSTLTLQTSNTCSLPTTITATPLSPYSQCGSSAFPCGSCTLAQSYSVVIDGMVARSSDPICAECVDFNAEYVVDMDESHPASVQLRCQDDFIFARWDFLTGTMYVGAEVTICGHNYTPILTVCCGTESGATAYRMMFYLYTTESGAGSFIAGTSGSALGQLDCEAEYEFVFPYVSGSPTGCDSSGVTVTITPIF